LREVERGDQLVIEDLQKIYKDRETHKNVHAIRGISLTIASGELVSLLGPSGCGKTTTLRCIAGFEMPDAGAIRFDGDDMVQRPPEQRDIGLVFQNQPCSRHDRGREHQLRPADAQVGRPTSAARARRARYGS
jgi:ABC-type sugar transport system ATPase subunit